MTDYSLCIALLLEKLGAHPRLPDDIDRVELIREYRPQIDGELEGERIGWRPALFEWCER